MAITLALMVSLGHVGYISLLATFLYNRQMERSSPLLSSRMGHRHGQQWFRVPQHGQEQFHRCFQWVLSRPQEFLEDSCRLVYWDQCYKCRDFP